MRVPKQGKTSLGGILILSPLMEDCFETTSNKVYSCVDLISSSTEPCLLFLSVRAVRTNSRTSFPVAIDDNDALLSRLAVDSAGQAVWRLPGPGWYCVLHLSTEEVPTQTAHFTANLTPEAIPNWLCFLCISPVVCPTGGSLPRGTTWRV